MKSDDEDCGVATNLSRRSFLQAAAAVTATAGLECKSSPTSPLLDSRLQQLVDRQDDAILIDPRKSTFSRFVLQDRRRSSDVFELSVVPTDQGYKLELLGESRVLSKLSPRLGFELRGSRLVGIDLDSYARLAATPEEVVQISAAVFDAMPRNLLKVESQPAAIDWPIVRLCEQVADQLPKLETFGSGPFGQLEVSLPDGRLRVERDNANDRMKLHLWVDEWCGLLLLPPFDGYCGLRRYVDALLDESPGISPAGRTGEVCYLDDPAELVELIENIVAVGLVTIAIAPGKTALTAICGPDEL